MHTYIHTHTHTHIYIYIYICIHTYIVIGRDVARKFYGRGPRKKKFQFFRIFLLKKIIFVVF
jgi:hypothetical protein